MSLSATALESLITILAKYGPTAAQAVLDLFKKADPTTADVDALFSQLKKYEDFGIPAVAPTAAASPS